MAGALLAAAPAHAEQAKGRDQFLVRPLVGYSSVELTFTPSKPQSGEGHPVSWEPNAATKVGARVGYGPFLVTAAFDTAPPDPKETHGDSVGLDLQFTGTLRLDGREIAGTAFFQRYHGFYLGNTQELFPGANSPLLAPRLALTTYGASFLFFSNPKFSYDDAFVEYRPHDSGAYSWGARVAMGHFGFDANGNSLIPGHFAADFGDAFGLTFVDATYASLGLGVAADWRPFGRVLLGVSGFVGATVAAAKFRIMGYERDTMALGPAVQVQAVAGWSGELIHGGIMSTVDLEQLRIEGTDVAAARVNALLFVGVRF